MPYQIVWEEGGVLIRTSGTLTDEELLQANRTLYGDPRFDGIAYQIFDVTEADVGSLSTDAVRLVAKLDREASRRNPDMAVAIVADELLARGLSNLYRIEFEGQGGTWKQSFFETEEAARRWIAELSL